MMVSTLKAIHTIKDGLNDPLVRTGHRLSLHQRATRMKDSASFKKHRLLLRELPSIIVQNVTHVSVSLILKKKFFGQKLIYKYRNAK